MRQIHFGTYVLFSLLFLFAFISCTEEETFENPVTESSSNFKKKGGNGKGNNSCTKYNFKYWVTSSLANSVFTADPTVINTCVERFKGVDRITEIKLGSTWSCIIENAHDTNGPGLVNCGAFLELYYYYNRRKYQVILEGGGWNNGCPPEENNGTSYFTFNKMYINPDGRHEKSCLAKEIPIDIGDHTFYIENLGPD